VRAFIVDQAPQPRHNQISTSDLPGALAQLHSHWFELHVLLLVEHLYQPCALRLEPYLSAVKYKLSGLIVLYLVHPGISTQLRCVVQLSLAIPAGSTVWVEGFMPQYFGQLPTTELPWSTLEQCRLYNVRVAVSAVSVAVPCSLVSVLAPNLIRASGTN